MKKLALTAIAGCLIPLAANAAMPETHASRPDKVISKPFFYETKVISDKGGYSVSEYMPNNMFPDEEKKKAIEKRRTTKLVDYHYPVRSKNLKVGRLGPKEGEDIKYQMMGQPMFMIGYDPVSINWLKANKGHLAKNKAIGLVVNVENKEQLKYLQGIAGNKVILQPTPGDSLAEHLKVKHYPFYMDNKGIMR